MTEEFVSNAAMFPSKNWLLGDESENDERESFFYLFLDFTEESFEQFQGWELNFFKKKLNTDEQIKNIFFSMEKKGNTIEYLTNQEIYSIFEKNQEKKTREISIGKIKNDKTQKKISFIFGCDSDTKICEHLSFQGINFQEKTQTGIEFPKNNEFFQLKNGQREFKGTGFHRTLVSEFILKNNSGRGGKIELLMVERLPSSFFIDKFEIDEIYKFDKKNLISFSEIIDLEKPSFYSTSHVVLFYQNVSFSYSFLFFLIFFFYYF